MDRIEKGVPARTEDTLVLLEDYLTFIGQGSSVATLFDDAERELFRRMRTALEGAYERAAARSGADLLRVSALSRDHGLDSPEPWVTGLLTKPSLSAGSFHPNALGMERVAGELVRLLA